MLKETGRTEFVDQVPVILQERAIFSPLRDVLRAAEVDVDAITVVLYKSGSGQELFWVVCTELDKEWSVHSFASFLSSDHVEMSLASSWMFQKHLRE